MKRFICLFLCAVAALSVCACEKKEDPEPTVQEIEETAAPIATIDETSLSAPVPTEQNDTDKLKEFIRSFDKTAAVEKAVVFQNDNLSVTASDIEYTPTGPLLHFSVENKTDKDIIAEAPHAVINGKMVTPAMSDKIPAGKSAPGSMAFLYFDLAISNITALNTVEFPLEVYDASHKHLEKTDLITVATTAPPVQSDPANEEAGQLALDRDQVKILIKGLNTDHTYDETNQLTEKLVVTMYNGTDHDISVRAEEIKVNGCELTPVMNALVYPGKQATSYVSIYDLDLEEFGIRSIDSITVRFSVKNPGSGEKFCTEPISVDLTDDNSINIATPDSVGTKKYEK